MNELRGNCRLKRVNLWHKEVRKQVTKQNSTQQSASVQYTVTVNVQDDLDVYPPLHPVK